MPDLNTPNPGCPTCEDYNCLCQHCELEERARENERRIDAHIKAPVYLDPRYYSEWGFPRTH